MMKTKFNFWSVIAVVAIILSAGAGYAGSTTQDEEATHYNAETNPNLPAKWQPILPGSVGENDCTLTSSRPCKSIQDEHGNFDVIAYGDLELN